MNIRLLRRIQRQILKEPKQLYMGWWYDKNPGWKVPNCGTAACIAGWAACLVKRISPATASKARWWPSKIAKRALELDSGQANLLFFEDVWPERFRHKKTPLARAKAAVKRIDHFIKTKGLE